MLLIIFEPKKSIQKQLLILLKQDKQIHSPGFVSVRHNDTSFEQSYLLGL